MNPLDPNTSRLPPPLRALVMGLVVDMVVPLLNKSREEGPAPSSYDGDGVDARTASWRDLRWKCEELSALVLQADNPEAAAAYLLDYLPKHFEYAFRLRAVENGSGCGEAPPPCTCSSPRGLLSDGL